jgi:GNAT superfamily N-acetyltransferase
MRRAVGILVLAAVAWTAFSGWSLHRQAEPLVSPDAPHGLVSLQLAPNPQAAARIRAGWACETAVVRCTDVLPIADAVLRREPRLIALSVVALCLLALWGAWVSRAARAFTIAVLGLILLGGIADFAGNHWIRLQLESGSSIAAADLADLVTLARLATMTRFVLLLLGGVGAVALAGGALRVLLLGRRGDKGTGDIVPPPPGARPSKDDELASFRELLRREGGGIFPTPLTRAPDVPVLADNRAADEPRVLFRAADVIGLALSGGGIRSATFNLGLLEGLHRLNLLPLFDYVSTVSGGGYIGSFWSEWLARQQEKIAAIERSVGCDDTHPQVPPDELFPSHRDIGSGPQDRIDSPQERHLREFGGFLAPRWGFFEVETWTAVVALISGLLPALAIALSVIGVLLIGWLSLTFALAYDSAYAPLPFILLVTWCTLYGFEKMWHEVKSASAGHTEAMNKGTPPPASVRRGLTRYIAVAWTSLAVVGALQLLLPAVYAALPAGRLSPVFVDHAWRPAAGASAFEQWWTIAGIANPTDTWLFSPRLFDFAIVWLAASLLMVALRVTHAVWPQIAARESLAAYDRVLMRILGLAVVWTGLALLWHLAVNLPSLSATIGATLVSGSVFAALRNWIGVALSRPTQPGMFARLTPYLPQALAYVTIVLAAAAVGRLLVLVCGTDWLHWWYFGAIMFALLLLGLFIDPAEYGLHAFYRERISRAYAGACNIADGQHAGQNRGTDPRAGDDRRLSRLVARPLQLVCCAANDLTGDPVETLARGSRSAVLSKHGFSIGRYWAPVGALHLGSAITASAAAFNSNMGRVSMKLGPVVAFLMTALNLRLGLWLRHPAAAEARSRRWPGLLLYREMMGLTSASGALSPEGPVPALMRDIHLSDGGHFENLALYELIRRHCRYVMMSDCGADPNVAFDDLGNAFRRVREDFGIDITLDIEPLRPDAAGWSRQHVAVGTIHYSPTDQGILVYLKPTMTGDEPPDVLQYKTRNTEFPHEGTGDQFYDEAQWESYRRLGLHAAEKVFSFVPAAGEPASGAAGPTSRARRATPRPLTADWVFAETAHAWGATPPGLVDRILEMTKRFSDLEAELQQRPVRGVLAEVFPEMAFLPASDRITGPSTIRAWSAAPPAGSDTPRPQDADIEAVVVSDLSCLLRVTQAMEDVWIACELDRWWTHPLNLGWINLFARWATAPSFRFWWPMMGPMFSPGFREFLAQRFPDPQPARVGQEDTDVVRPPQRSRVIELDPKAPEGLAVRWWKNRASQPRDWDGKTLFQNLLRLPRPNDEPLEMQVGIAAVTINDGHAGWTSDDFFVPPSLWGAGIGWYFLDELLHTLAETYSRCYVIVKAPPVDAQHKVAMDDRRAFIEQYRKIGFREQLVDRADEALDETLTRSLGLELGVDTLLVLDLQRWARRRGR